MKVAGFHCIFEVDGGRLDGRNIEPLRTACITIEARSDSPPLEGMRFGVGVEHQHAITTWQNRVHLQVCLLPLHHQRILMLTMNSNSWCAMRAAHSFCTCQIQSIPVGFWCGGLKDPIAQASQAPWLQR